MTDDAIRLLEPAHTMSVLLYVLEHDGCMKTDVYRAICHNSTMARKLDALRDAGLLVHVLGDDATRLHLTEKGRRVAEILGEIRRVIGEDGDREERGDRAPVGFRILRYAGAYGWTVRPGPRTVPPVRDFAPSSSCP